MVVPGENTPELAVTKDDLNAGGHYERPLNGPHALEEPLLPDEQRVILIRTYTYSRRKCE